MQYLLADFKTTVAISIELIQTINEICARVENAPETKEVRFVFAQSEDLRTESHISDVGLMHKWEKALRRVENLDVLIIAICVGECSIAATSIVSVADLRVGAPSASFCLKGKEVTIPGMLVHRLINQLSASWVRSFVLRGNTLSADKALKSGFLDGISDSPLAFVDDAVSGMNSHVFTDIRVRRKLMLEAHHTSYDETIGLSLSAGDRVFRKNKTNE